MVALVRKFGLHGLSLSPATRTCISDGGVGVIDWSGVEVEGEI